MRLQGLAERAVPGSQLHVFGSSVRVTTEPALRRMHAPMVLHCVACMHHGADGAAGLWPAQQGRRPRSHADGPSPDTNSRCVSSVQHVTTVAHRRALAWPSQPSRRAVISSTLRPPPSTLHSAPLHSACTAGCPARPGHARPTPASLQTPHACLAAQTQRTMINALAEVLEGSGAMTSARAFLVCVWRPREHLSQWPFPRILQGSTAHSARLAQQWCPRRGASPRVLRLARASTSTSTSSTTTAAAPPPPPSPLGARAAS